MEKFNDEIWTNLRKAGVGFGPNCSPHKLSPAIGDYYMKLLTTFVNMKDTNDKRIFTFCLLNEHMSVNGKEHLALAGMVLKAPVDQFTKLVMELEQAGSAEPTRPLEEFAKRYGSPMLNKNNLDDSETKLQSSPKRMRTLVPASPPKSVRNKLTILANRSPAQVTRGLDSVTIERIPGSGSKSTKPRTSIKLSDDEEVIQVVGTNRKTHNPAMPANVNQSRLQPQELEAFKKSFYLSLPMSRPLRADIFRGLMLREPESKVKLLAKVGIHFKPRDGNFILPKEITKNKIEHHFNELSKLVEVQWAVIMAENIFRLVVPDDKLTLHTVGIHCSPTHPKIPLFYRMQDALRKRVLSNPTDGMSMAKYLVKTFELRPSKLPHVKAVSQVLECDESAAEDFIRKGLVGNQA